MEYNPNSQKNSKEISSPYRSPPASAPRHQYSTSKSYINSNPKRNQTPFQKQIFERTEEDAEETEPGLEKTEVEIDYQAVEQTMKGDHSPGRKGDAL